MARTRATSGRISKKTLKPQSQMSVPSDELLAIAQRVPERQPLPDNQSRAFLNMLESGIGSDLTLRCGGEAFKVHSFVLMSQSEFFTACMQSGMRETIERVIDLVDEDPKDVRRMLEFLYGGSYWEHTDLIPEEPRDLATSKRLYKTFDDIHQNNNHEQRSPLMVNVSMFGLADKFGIPALKKEVLKKVRGFVETLEPKSYCKGGEARAELLLPYWQVLLGAADYMYYDGTATDELIGLLLAPVARVASHISEFVPDKFQDLLQRASSNHDLCFHLLQMTCIVDQMAMKYLAAHSNLK